MTTARPDWGDLVVESGTPPVWTMRPVVIARSEGEWSLWVSAAAWRTRRMDVSVSRPSELWSLDAAQRQIFEEVARLAVAALDWSLDVRAESREDTFLVGGEREIARRRLIVQVGEGRQLEPVINMLARFQERQGQER